ncbi:BTB_2 domain-containing protein [Meloidogyne graminicola]|uniref:BTB_2 domain-containing protein n=1 Tax=Meloidogyne graminicola TaxID=189291 RepID=A0A8S9ZRT1_9BILA|nr:BTB_2 domain-containing protein [Meloidogyne graminicola]
MPDFIEFNVGGKYFASTYETIAFDKNCILYSWYIERKGLTHLNVDRKGRFFIDRDPNSFGIILNYLRLQANKQLWEVCLPKDPDRLALLTQEAEYFRLPKLRDQAISLLRKCTNIENGGDYVLDDDYVNELGKSRIKENEEIKRKENGENK